MARNKDQMVIILWRDIPAQVNGQRGADRHQVILPHRFQKAIDRAAMVAGKKTAQEYVGEWRRATHPIAGELVESIDATAANIEAEFSNERLNTLVTNGGWDPLKPQVDLDTVPTGTDTTTDTPDTPDTTTDTTQDTPS
jgi:Virulence factor